MNGKGMGFQVHSLAVHSSAKSSAQTRQHPVGQGGNDFFLFRVAGGEDDQNEFGAGRQFDVGGIMADFAGPAGFGPEFRTERQNGAKVFAGLYVGVRIERLTFVQGEHLAAAFRGDGAASDKFREQARGGFGGEPVAMIRRRLISELFFAAIRSFTPGFAIGVDVFVAEAGKVVVHDIALGEPRGEFRRGQFRSTGGIGEQIQNVTGGFVVGVNDHVMQRAAQFFRVRQLAGFEPVMSRDEVKRFDDAGGINAFRAAITGAFGFVGVPQIHQRDGELLGLQIKRGELGQHGLNRVRDDGLQPGAGMKCEGGRMRLRHVDEIAGCAKASRAQFGT
jgi:hypothetical protein